MSDHKLKVGDKIKSPGGDFYDVLEVEGRFALVRAGGGRTYPIMFHDGAWRSFDRGPVWTVVKPRWRVGRWGEQYVIYDGDRSDGHYAVAFWDSSSDLAADQVAGVVEAFVDLLNERFPA